MGEKKLYQIFFSNGKFGGSIDGSENSTKFSWDILISGEIS